VVRSLIALPLPEAMAAIEEAGQRVSRVMVTGPPGAGKGEGLPRVIREEETPEGVELTVAFPVPPPADGGRS
jgi:HrpA-like RNA helicase